MYPIYDKPFRHPSTSSLGRFGRKGKRKVGRAEYVSLLKSLEWYEPQETSGPVHFFRDTSLHGLHYLGQRKRHICERVFWLTAFTIAVAVAAILISHVWSQYKAHPIIIAFSHEQTKLNQIPFPAVTICSVSKIRNSIHEGNVKDALSGIRGTLSNKVMLENMASIIDTHHICYATKTFTSKFHNSTITKSELTDGIRKNRGKQLDNLLDAVSTLRKSSQTCEEMILYCLWLDGKENCSELFQRVSSDFGACCTFNMIPLSLLKRFTKHAEDNYERVKGWEKADLNYDNLLLDKVEQNNSRKYPHRQRYPGRSAGLSILLDPDTNDYSCTSTDSEGFVIGLNSPLDFPRMKDNGIAIRSSTEVFIGVHPEITMSDDSVKKFGVESRHCYFEGEKKLDYYTKYTPSNCMDECISKKTLEECNCLRYYMPRGGLVNETNCRPQHYQCTVKVRENIIKGGLDTECSDCLPACTDIHYHMQTTSLRIREARIRDLLEKNSDKHENYDKLLRRAKNVSIVHVYINVDSIFPRLRTEMTTGIDLLSSAGGILGLCMGFSLLSLLEIIYHATLRVLCRFYRNQSHEKVTKISGNCGKANNMIFSTGVPGKQEIGTSLFNMHDWQSNPKKDNLEFLDNVMREDIFKIGKSEQKMLPVYFPSTFEADFQRAYHATAKVTWIHAPKE